MLYSIVDIGANSIRMNIYGGENSEYSIVRTARSMLGLAALVSNRRMTEEGIRGLIDVLKSYKEVSDEERADRFLCFATESLRAPENSAEVVSRIKAETGIEVEIISGIEEALYDFEAVKHRFDISGRTGAVVDMGGGSTELVAFSGELPKAVASLKLGCLAMYRYYIRSKDPDEPYPTPYEQRKIMNYSAKLIRRHPEFYNVGGVAYLIGGTARAIAKLYGDVFDKKIRSVSSLSIYEFKRIKMLARADIETHGDFLRRVVGDRLKTIVPGILAYDEILTYLGTKHIIVCDCGVRDGFFIKNRQ